MRALESIKHPKSGQTIPGNMSIVGDQAMPPLGEAASSLPGLDPDVLAQLPTIWTWACHYYSAQEITPELLCPTKETPILEGPGFLLDAANFNAIVAGQKYQLTPDEAGLQSLIGYLSTHRVTASTSQEANFACIHDQR